MMITHVVRGAYSMLRPLEEEECNSNFSLIISGGVKRLYALIRWSNTISFGMQLKSDYLIRQEVMRSKF